MALTTRCPNCRTAFKVVADQLRVRGGLVRCGECGTVFDGRACLEDEAPPAAPSARTIPQPVAPPPAAPQPAAPQPAAPQPAAPAVLRGRAGRPVEPHRADAAFEDDSFGALDDEPFEEPRRVAEPSVSFGADEPEAEPEFEPAKPLRAVYGETRMRSGSTDAGRAPPAFLDRELIRTHATRRRIWGWLCLVGLLALALQLIYVWRTPIALAAPVLRPPLAQACKAFGCTVGYARRIERIFIESSSLHAAQGQSAQPGDDGRTRLVLTAVLRNRYDRDQEWPSLVLELTDMSDTVVARKVIAPAVYLPPGAAGGPMAAGSEMALTVPVEVSDLAVNGYQLQKFFP